MEELELTPDMEHDYLDNPFFCPFCGSDDLYPYPFNDYEGQFMTRDVKCRKCKKQWTEHFELTNIYNPEQSE